MSFLYLNIGYSSMFDESTFTEENSLLYNKQEGISVSEGYGIIKLSSTPKILCCKLNVISESNTLDGLIVSVEANGTNKKFIIGFDSDNLFYQCNDSGRYYISYSNLINAYGLNTLWFYVIPYSEGTGGILQCALNSRMLFNVSNQEIGFPADCFIKVSSNYSNLHLFNFIISDQQFDYSCEVVSCPSTITTELESNDDGYIVTGDNQMILHKLDVSSLVDTYTKKAQVFGISLTSTYNAGSTPNISLNSIEKKNSSYKTTSTSYLDSPSGCVRYATLLTNLTLNNMKNRVYGWSVKG